MNFQVELTSYCDLTCGYCPNRGMERGRSFMGDEVWRTILHEYIVPYRHTNAHCPPTFIGHKDGEPLLNKRFPDRLLDLSRAAPDMKIDIYSHGLMLPKLAQQGRDFFEFLATLPNQVRYMMSFHPHNHDGSANNYSATMVYLKEVLRAPPPNVEFITVSHRSKWVTPAMQESWRQWWEGSPITVHSNCSLNPWTGRIEEEGTTRFNGCPYADFGHWFFGVTGNVIACCLDLEEEIVLGNVLEETPAELFNRTDVFYAAQRSAQQSGARPLNDVCADCYGFKRQPQLLQLGTAR